MWRINVLVDFCVVNFGVCVEYSVYKRNKWHFTILSPVKSSGLKSQLARYILDNMEMIRDRRVLDVGCGCGAGAIAAAMRNAQRVIANDIDPYAVMAAKINAEFNKIKVETDTNNFVGSSCNDFDVILIGDMFYDEEFASLLFEWLHKLTADNKLVLIGDPGRHGLTASRRSQMTLLANYELPKETRDENNGFTHTTVWRLNKL
ncbi:electron transfer flavoprotein beta subunit lysine methyltransferase-like isoform X2 [Maniola hyperantus]|uniref:electron transfer flavoprotein beta subunit lysine methyltransferase-like isoform X2 n=1 Tax=Aphantopus hyperantus TaxID=2795564 RepID=UPI003749053A